MIGKGCWSTGIEVRYHALCETWVVSLKFYDDELADEGDTEGVLRSRYEIPCLSTAIDVLKADAERLGITWRSPTLYVPGDGEHKDETYHPEWRSILAAEARRLGWGAPPGTKGSP